MRCLLIVACCALFAVVACCVVCFVCDVLFLSLLRCVLFAGYWLLCVVCCLVIFVCCCVLFVVGCWLLFDDCNYSLRFRDGCCSLCVCFVHCCL